jgi:hypothetical protein
MKHDNWTPNGKLEILLQEDGTKCTVDCVGMYSLILMIEAIEQVKVTLIKQIREKTDGFVQSTDIPPAILKKLGSTMNDMMFQSLIQEFHKKAPQEKEQILKDIKGLMGGN